MWDVLFGISAVNAFVFGVRSLCVVPGFGLAGCVLAVLGTFEALPAEMQHHGIVSLFDLICMGVLQDGLQFFVHIGEHRSHNTSHKIHHENVHPHSRDAFHTGWVDALTQLLVPLCVTLWSVRPNKTTAGAFGLLYALWLQWIHADDALSLKLRSRVFVTPTFHRRHHTHPNCNFGHILVFWDWMLGTAHVGEAPSTRKPLVDIFLAPGRKDGPVDLWPRTLASIPDPAQLGGREDRRC